MLIHTCACVETKPEASLECCSSGGITLFFETGSLTVTQSSQICKAGLQQALGIHLFVSLRCQDF